MNRFIQNSHRFVGDIGKKFMHVGSECKVRLRKQALGTRNLVGARVEMARKSQGMRQKGLLAQPQVSGVDMTPAGMAKREGQTGM